jgi:hypothetical protein
MRSSVSTTAPATSDGDTTGAVLYRVPDGLDIMEPDISTLVLRPLRPDHDIQLMLRDVRSGTEHQLATTCPALQPPPLTCTHDPMARNGRHHPS